MAKGEQGVFRFSTTTGELMGMSECTAGAGQGSRGICVIRRDPGLSDHRKMEGVTKEQV